MNHIINSSDLLYNECVIANRYGDTMQLTKGTKLFYGRYSIMECIGDGGFGITYVAWDDKLDREVVLKEYFPDYMAKRDITASNDVLTMTSGYDADMKTGISKFMKEAKTLAHLNHISAIATVHDYFEENQTAYIVMEYIKGKNLKQIIRERTVPFTLDEALKILEPCMSALDGVHAAGIIHRDFAPDNILINEKGEAKIIDFGSSRDFVSNNATMTIMVKHGYAPIEQYSGASKQGPYTDVYSLAAILYEMLTLKKPMPSIDRVAEDILIVPSQINSGVSKEQDEVIKKGLAVVHSGRYQSVKEFSDALHRVSTVEKKVARIEEFENTVLVNSLAQETSANSALNNQYGNVYNSQSTNSSNLYNDRATELVNGASAVKQINEVSYKSNEAVEQGGIQRDEKYEPKGKIKSKNKAVPVIIGIVAAIVIIYVIALNAGEAKDKFASTPANNHSSENVTVSEKTENIQERQDTRDNNEDMQKNYVDDTQSKVNVGDTVQFGRYKWQVLAKENNKALLITTKAISDNSYNKEWVGITWENCTLRRWLNNDFYNEFSDDEKKLIASTYLENKDNSEYGTYGGNDTEDKVFLLSIDEANRYFANDSVRAEGTTWWLRSPGKDVECAAAVRADGSILEFGCIVNSGGQTVRPAIWIDINTNGNAQGVSDLYVIVENTQEELGIDGEQDVMANSENIKEEVGDTVQFGDYEWRILAKADGKALLITTKSVGQMAYYPRCERVTWEESTIREWLNDDFYNEFSDEEKSMIAVTHLVNKGNDEYGISGGNDTEDKIFILSVDEAKTYFADDNDRKMGLWWWLRSPGYKEGYVTSVLSDGSVYESGDIANTDRGDVHPAMWVNLE